MSWVFIAILAAGFKSLATITEKKLLGTESMSEYLSGISIFISILSLPLLLLVKNFSFTGIDLLITLGISMISVMSAASITYVIKKVDISESSALLAMTPIFVTVCGFIFLGERVTAMQLGGIALSSLGLFILEKKRAQKQPVDRKLYIVLVLSLIFFAISTIGDRYMVHYRNIDPILFLIIVQICISINFVIYDIQHARKNKSKSSFIDHKLFREKYFWLNSILIIGHRITHMFGVNLIEAGIFNAAKQINAIFTTVIGGTLFKEKELMRKTFACIIIVTGVLLVTL